MLLVHWARRAASRADWTAGSRREMRTAMIAMTTRSSMSVKPREFLAPRRSAVMMMLLRGPGLEENTKTQGIRSGPIVHLANKTDKTPRNDRAKKSVGDCSPGLT